MTQKVVLHHEYAQISRGELFVDRVSHEAHADGDTRHNRPDSERPPNRSRVHRGVDEDDGEPQQRPAVGVVNANYRTDV